MAGHLRYNKHKKLVMLVVLFLLLVHLPANLAQNPQYKVIYRQIPDNRGTEFVIGFMQQFQKESDGAIRLFITSDYNTQAVIEVPEVYYKTTIDVKARQLHSVDVSNALRMRGTKVENKGILVKSKSEVVVYGLNIKKYTTDAFLALPVDIQSTRYIIPSFTVSQNSLIGIIGIHKDTTVFITFRFAEKKGRVKFKGRRYRHGDTLSLTLSRLESFQIAHKSDMTGTRIISTKPISVFSGNECANVPLEKGYCDHLVEHIPPVNTWGLRFITAPLAGRTSGDFFRILAANDSTHVKVNGRLAGTLDEGEFIQLDVPSNRYQHIETSKPCLVLQFSKGSKVDDTKTDPFMIMIPPVEQYTAQYTVSTPDQSSKYFDSYINIIIETQHIDGVRLDGRSLRNEKWIPVWGTKHSAVQLAVSHGVHRVMHDSPIVPFAIFLYGYAKADSYGYPGGLRLADLTLECVPGNPGDGMDNDCDRRIDEEIKNYIDDDDDGRIDEDLVTEPPRFVLEGESLSYRGCPSSAIKLVKEPTVVSAPLCTSRGQYKLTYSDQVLERNCVQTITRRWFVRDGCGNLENTTQTIKITRPDFHVIFPADIRGKCNQGTDLSVTGKPRVTNKCKEDVISVRYKDKPALEECIREGRTISREWTVKASCGASVKRVQKLYPDVTPPKLTFVGKLQYQVKRDFKIRWSANEESTFQCALDNPNELQDCGKGFVGTWAKSDIPDGKHKFWVRGTDLSGNIGALIVHPFNVDKSGPRLLFIRPLKKLSRGDIIIRWRSPEVARFKCGLSPLRMEQCGSGKTGRRYLNKLRDGVHSFYVGARDAIGNEAKMIRHTFTIDSTPPRIKFARSRPPNTNSNVEIPILSNEYATFSCALDNPPVFRPCEEGLTGKFLAEKISEGPHILQVKAVDKAGNVGGPIVLTWNSDKTSPNIIFTPGLPTKFRGLPEITWSSSEEAKFECALDNFALRSPCGQGMGGTWQQRVNDGPHVLYVRGTDEHGNVGRIARFSFQMDNQPPSVRLNRPLPRTSTANTTTFRWTSSEMAYFQCAVDTPTNPVRCGSGTNGEWTTPALSNGNHRFFLTAKDEVGNKASPVQHRWKIDNVAPNLRFLGSLPDNANTKTQKFRWISTEHATYHCSVDSATEFSRCRNGRQGHFTTKELDDGPHTFRVKGIDPHGNEGPVLKHSWTIDTQPPTVTLGEVPSTLNKPRVKFTWDSSEPSKFRCAIDDDEKGVPCGFGTDGEFLTANLTDGEHEFKLMVEDEVGNKAPVVRAKFKIDTTGPVIKFDQRSPITPQDRIRVSWTSSEDSEFECALNDLTKFEKCGRGRRGLFEKDDLPDGEHKLYVRGRDKTDNLGKPSLFIVTTDKTPPSLKFTDNAKPLSKKPSELFTWSSSEVARFKCQVDNKKETDCGSGRNGQFATPDLPDGEHIFRVTPIDGVGNRGKPVEREWKIDRTPPTIRYTDQPPKESGDRATFKWTSSERATFECALDSVDKLAPCGSGTTGERQLSRLPKGNRVFWVRGTDEAGNVGQFVSHPWTVDKTPPTIQFTGDLPSFSKKSLTLSWRSSEKSVYECALDNPSNYRRCGSGMRGQWTKDDLPEGRHTFYVRARDQLNNIGKPISHSWTVDSIPPRAVLSQVPPITNSPKITLSWTANENSKFFCAIGDVGNTIECGQGTSGSWTTPYLRRGPQQFWLIAEDFTGNKAEPVTVKWTIDSDAPTVTFSKDSTTKTTTDTPKFSWTSDEEATFQCAIQGVTRFRDCGSGTTGTWTGSDVPDGKHRFLVRARDKYGNEKQSPFSFPFEIDSTPPTGFTITVPSSRTRNPKATFKWRTSEDSKFDCLLDNQTDATNCGSGREGTHTTQPLPDGTHEFKVFATDDLGNKAPVVNRRWTIDTTGPRITFPSNSPTTTLSSPRFTWNSSEPARFECSLDDPLTWRQCGGGTTGTWQGENLPDGKHTLYVRGKDILGNTGRPNSHQFNVDNAAPELKLTRTPRRNSSSPTFAWTSSEDVVFECSLDDAPFTQCGKGRTGTWQKRNMKDGLHKFSVQGKDVNGNTARHTHTWRIDATPPTLQLTDNPPKVSNQRFMIFRWQSDESSSFTCVVEGLEKPMKPVLCGYGKYGQYVTPLLPDGKLTFAVTAVDSSGNKGESAKHTWQTDSSPPRIKVNPETSIYSTVNPRFTWTSSEDATFECAIDDTRLYEDCGEGKSGTFTANKVPNGVHMFFIRGKDRFNNYGDHVRYRFRVDTFAPQVYFTKSVPPKTRNPAVNFAWTSSENSRFECKLDGKVVECGSGRAGKYTTPDMPDGKHTFSLNTVDNVGNRGTPEVVTWETDSTPPEIKFASNLKKKTSSNPQATWTSSEPAKFECALDNPSRSTRCGSGTYGRWNDVNVPEGPHTLFVRGTDNLGNVGPWKRYSFDVDSSGPVISFPSDIPKVTKRSPTFSWTSSEPAKFKCGIDNSNNLEDCGQGITGNWTGGRDISDGQHLFLVYGVDDMNNRGPYKQHLFTVDSRSPVITFTRIPETTPQSTRLSWRSSENARFECKLDDGEYKDCGRGVSGVWMGSNLPHGKHVLSVRGKDENNNVGEPTRHTWNVDAQPPKVTIREPFPKKTSNAIIRIRWSSDEDASFKCALNNVNNKRPCGYGKEGLALTPRLPDGEHVFYIIAEDRFKNRAPIVSRRWSVDTTPPDVKVNPDTSVYKTANPTFTWTSSEEATFECAIDNTELYQDCGSGTVGIFTAKNVPNGEHRFYVRGKDSVNNYGDHVAYPFFVDTLAPRVNLISSVPPKTRNPRIAFRWTSSEDSKFECTLNGKVVDCGSGRQGRYLTPNLPDGNHTFSLNTVDSVGNKGVPVVVNWEVDATPPEVKVNRDRDVYNTSNPTFTWTSSEDATFECAIDDTRLYKNCGEGKSGTFTPPTDVPSGSHAFFIRAKDKLNNYGEHVQHLFKVDTRPPAVYLTNNVPPRTRNPEVTFGWFATEDSNFVCKLDGKSVDCGSGRRGRYTTPELPDGKHTFSLTPVDKVGNEGRPLIVNWERDSSGPVIQLASNLPKKTKESPEITWTSSEPAYFECALDNVRNKFGCNRGTNGRWSFIAIPKGPHTFWVRGTDNLGNVGNWKSYKFEVDKTGPKISFPDDLPKLTNKKNPSFTWTSSEPAKFKCGFDSWFELEDCGQGLTGRKTGKDLSDGSHVFIVYGVDDMGNQGKPERHVFRVDSSSPVITISQLPDKTRSSPRITWTSTEDANFECSLDGAKYESCGSGWNGQWTRSDIPDGKHVLSIRGRDQNGNVGEPSRHTWTVDNKGPKVSITEPFPKKTPKPVIAIRWKSDEDARFSCAVDNIENARRCGFGKDGQYVTPRVPDGEHTFYLISEDTLGNKGETVTRKWTVDSSAPQITINDDKSVYKTSKPTFSWKSSEDASFECAIDDTSLYQDCGRGMSGTHTAENVPDGKHVFFVRAKDDVKNYGDDARYPFVVDTRAPLVFLTKTVPSKTNNPRVNFAWTSNEDSRFECELDGRAVDCGSGLRGRYTTPKLPDGKHTFSLTPVDKVGNKGTPKLVKWETDATPPVIQFSKNLPKITKENPQISWTSSEPSSFECALDNRDNKLPCGSGTNGQWSDKVPKGSHTFWVRGKDDAKNVGEWQPFTFKTDITGPEITFPKNMPKVTKKNPTFTWTSSEYGKFKCGVGNTFNLKDCGQGTSGSWTGRNLPNGPQEFIVYGVDDMDNQGPYARYKFTVDNKGPVISFSKVSDITNSSPLFSWTSTEDARFECSLDGAEFKYCGSGFNGDWTGKHIPHGKHVLSVRGRDKYGNVGRPTRHTWNVDRNAPNVVLREPFPKKTNIPVLTIQWTSDEDAKFKCAVDDVSRSVPCGYGKEGQWVTPRVSDGEHTFYLISEDPLGNRGPVVSRKWTVDTKFPVLTFSSGLPRTTNKNPRVTWTSSENASFECFLDDFSNKIDCGSGLSGSWNGQNLTDGRHVLWVQGKDDVGNSGLLISHTWIVDDSGPRLRFIGILPPRARKMPVFRWVSNELATFECSLNNATFTRCGRGASGRWSRNEIPSGRHVLRVRGRDYQGILGEPISHEILIDNTGPQMKLLPPLPTKTKEAAMTFVWTSNEPTKFACAVDKIQNEVKCGQGMNGRFTTKPLRDGNHVFYLLGEDELGNTARAVSHRWTVDKKKPQIEFLPNQPKVSTSNVTLRWRTVSQTPASFECSLDNSRNLKPCGSGRTGSWTGRDIPDGRRVLYVRAKDSFNDFGRVKSHRWTVDTKVPNVKLVGTPPKRSTYVTGSFFWRSDEIANFECAVDVVETAIPCGKGRNVGWLTSSLSEGEHTFYLFATDINGNKAKPIQYKWTIDSKPPIVTMDESNKPISGKNVTIRWKSNEFASFQCAVDNIFDNRNCGSGTNGKLVLKNLQDGYHTIWIKAVDALENTAEWKDHSWLVDSRPPKLTFTSELPKKTNSTAKFFWSTGEISTFQCGTDKNNLKDCGRGLSSNWTGRDLPKGVHRFYVRATDPFGNTVTIDHVWTVDTEPPILTFTKELPLVSGKTLEVEWRSDEWAEFFCAHENINDMEPCGTGFKSSWLEDDLPEGKHRFWVIGVDKIGNRAKPLSHEWIVDTKGPTLFFNEPVPKKSGRSVRFSWRSNENAKFLCAFDNPEKYLPCGQGFEGDIRTDNLKRNGQHRIFVKGVDDHGNEGDPITTTWTVDLIAPVLIDVGPLPRLTNRNPVITWRVNEVAIFECALDNLDKFKWCGNGTKGEFRGEEIKPGPHQLVVRVKDPQGNSQPIINHTFVVGIPDNRGREFVIGFMQQYNRKRAGSVTVFITSDNKTTAQIRIPGLNYKRKLRLEEDELIRVDLPLSTRMSGTAKERKGILITANHEVVVYGLNIMPHSTDAYLALPTDIQGTEYYAVSYTVSQNSLIAVIGIEDRTLVYITLKMRNDIPLVYMERVYRDGDTLIIRLNRLETFQLAHKVDLTGTRIASTKVISVYSGNECANVPKHAGYCDHLVEMLTPTSTWGRRFVTAPLFSRESGDFFRVVASKDNTVVRFHPDSKYIIHAGEFVERDVASDEYQFITATNPCILMQYSKGANTDNTNTDPFLIMIPPIEQYSSHYILSTPDRETQQYFSSYINVIVLSKHEKGVLVDGRPAYISHDFVKIKGTPYSAAAVSVTKGVHRVDHTSPIVTFGAFMYGYAWRDSYGYPGGLRLADITGDCTGVDTPADGMDNDCDRRIDEELKNGIDDDGDGRIDEDLATFPPVIQLSQTYYEYESCTLEVDALVPRAKAVGSVECEYKGRLRLTFTDKVNEMECALKINRTWQAADGCGNVVYLSQIIKITKPRLVIKYPVHVPNGCRGSTELRVTGEPLIEGFCKSERVKMSYRDNISEKECQSKGLLLERTFKINEICGREYTGVQYIYPGPAN